MTWHTAPAWPGARLSKPFSGLGALLTCASSYENNEAETCRPRLGAGAAGVHPLLARLCAAPPTRRARRLTMPGAPAAARRRAQAGAAATLLADAIARTRLASSPTTTATAPPPAPWACAACACWAPGMLSTWCPTAWWTATASPPDRQARGRARRRHADHRGQRHRQRRGRGGAPRRWAWRSSSPTTTRRAPRCWRPTPSSTPTSPAAPSRANPWPAWA